MRRVPAVLLLCMLGAVASGCRYLQNRADDLGDIFQLGIGGTTAAETPIPPGLGLYIEATEFLHFGGMAFSGIMAEIDRRGSAITHVNEDCRWGFGPFHKWHRDEVYGPADRYKSGEMPTWEERMAAKSYETHAFSDLLHVKEQSIPAKRMRFEGDALGRYPRGWQDWGFIGVDLALSEPFLIHAGFRLRVGVDVSQVTDLLVGLFGLDLYGDDPTETEYEGLYDHSPEGR